MNKSIILMSGGLDSVVALGYCLRHTNYNIKLALTFDYGQKSAEEEIRASKEICKYYNIEHKIIKLDWLKEITKTSLVSDIDIPEKDLNTDDSMKSVWVPNRNALFLNIAGCFCDSFGYKYIIFGANKDEGQTFSDNTESFRAKISECLELSTIIKPKVVAPLINYTKGDIVKIAVEDSIPLELIRSCYKSGEKHCGVCESCTHLKKALMANNCSNYIKILFKDDEN